MAHSVVSALDDAAEDIGPRRRCIVTGEVRDRAALLRFVVGPGGKVVPDIAARLPGRGLWLTPCRDIVEKAVAKRVFARAARRPVDAAAELADQVEALLARHCCDRLGLVRRAGAAVAGFDRVEEVLRAHKTAALFFAVDAAESGRRRLAALGRDLPAAAVLTGAEMGGAFGRERVAHVSIGPGRLGAALLADARRLCGFRAGATVVNGMAFAPARPERQDGGTEPT